MSSSFVSFRFVSSIVVQKLCFLLLLIHSSSPLRTLCPPAHLFQWKSLRAFRMQGATEAEGEGTLALPERGEEDAGRLRA